MIRLFKEEKSFVLRNWMLNNINISDNEVKCLQKFALRLQTQINFYFVKWSLSIFDTFSIKSSFLSLIQLWKINEWHEAINLWNLTKTKVEFTFKNKLMIKTQKWLWMKIGGKESLDFTRLLCCKLRIYRQKNVKMVLLITAKVWK